MLSELNLFTAFIYAMVFLYGIVIGSFLNVCIYRIPKKENIATERSHCMKCGAKLQWYDLVPLLSWLLLKGKCRYCGTRISIQYPLIELINGVGYVWIFAVNGFNFVSILFALCLSALLALSIIDWRTFEIPVAFNIFILILGIARAIYDFEHIWTYLIGMVAVSGFLMLIFIFTGGNGIGGGDIKLMAAAGLLLGLKCILAGFLLGCILGSVIHILLMIFLKKDRTLAFGPYLSMGIFLAMLYGEQLADWYIGLLY